jgi:hypothetical protein
LSTLIQEEPMRQILSMLLLYFVPALCLRSQVATGTITGTVSDPSQALIPSAEVKIKNVETGLVRVTKTDSAGLFTTSNLPTGRYSVEVTTAGFQPQSTVGLVLSIDQTLTVNFTLTPGQLQQSVTVMARSEQLLETSKSSLGQVMEEQPIRELPLNGRSYQQLIALNTGSQPGPQGSFTSGNYHINGGRGEGNSFLIDGVDVSSSFSDPQRINPAIESIAEFKILTNNFSAEYGRSVGGVISVQIKSGTNEIHGTLFEFLRNDKVDARNFFAAQKAPYRFNQFGGSVGGPIKRNKAFYFLDYQGTRVRYSGVAGYGGGVPTSSTAEGLFTVPSAAQRAGDFSALFPKTVIYDPATGNPFPNNLIPQTRFDTPVAKMVSLLPMPNQPGVFNFRSSLPAEYQGDGFDTRVDYHISDRNMLSASVNFNQINGKTRPPFGTMNGNLITTDYPHNEPRRVSVSDTHTFGPRAVNELILGFSRDRWFGPATDGHEYVPDLGIRYLNTSEEDPHTTGYPLFIIPGLSVFGGPAGAPFNFATNIPQVADNFSWIRGTHFLKTGFVYRARQFNMDQSIFPRGLYVFNALSTSKAGVGGDTFASALLGYPLVGQKDLSSPWGQRNKEYGIYLQDDYKVNQRLTLNLGIRWDLFMPATEAYDRISNFNPATKGLILAGKNGVSTSTLDANKHNFGPRVGFAYTPFKDRNTVLRGGYALSYLPLMTAAPGTSTRLTMNPPFRNNFSQVFSFLSPTVRVSDGLLIPQPDLANPSGDIVYIPKSQPFPYMQYWTFDVQRTLTPSLLLDIAYAGSRGVHMTGVVNLNQAPPGPTPPGGRSPISTTINNLSSLLNRENSIYHSLQAKLERRFAAGFYLMAAYTFSKSIDDGSYTSQGSDASSVAPQDSRNWRAERGLSDFDAAHRFVVSYIYELPFGKGKPYLSGSFWGHVIGGWQLNGITTAQTGTPFTPVVANPRTNAGPGGAIRPDRLRSGDLGSARSISQWFDKTAFLVQGTGGSDPYHFGNSGRNILRGPGLVSFDFSAFRYFPLTERVKLQFRAEFFNLFNHANFALPAAAVDTPQAGIISAARDPREIQFALKLLF